MVGRVAEWLKAPDSKSGVGASLPWVRIPPSPPDSHVRRLLTTQTSQIAGISGYLMREANRRAPRGAAIPRGAPLPAPFAK